MSSPKRNGPSEDPISAFAEAARSYCELIDNPGTATEQDWRALAKAMAQLHFCALDLPDAFEESAPDLFSALGPRTERIAAWVSRLPVELYWDIFEPFAIQSHEPVCNALTEDLADIYSDLRRGLALFDMGHVERAAWDWRFNFYAHWGEHLVGAQRALFLASRG